MAAHPRWLVVAAFLVLAAVVLRVMGLGERPLFRDEAASWLEARYPLAQLLEHAAGEPYPPLYALMLHWWMPLAGDGEAALRAMSVVAALGFVVVAWWWAHEALGRWPGLVALAVAAFSPLAIANARDARMYAWEALFATLAWWLLWRLLTGGAAGSPSRRGMTWHGVLLAVVVAGELWTLALGIVVAAWQVLVVGLAVLLEWRRRGRPDHPRTALAAGSLVAVIAVAIGCISFLPWLPRMVAAATNGEPYWTPIPGLFDWVLSARVALIGWLDDANGNVAAIVLLGLAVTGIAALLRSTEPGARRLGYITLAVAAMVPSIWAVSQVRSIYDHRYFGTLVAPLALAIAAGAAVVGRRAVRWAADRRRGGPGEDRSASMERRGIVAALVVVSLLTAPFAWTWLMAWRSETDGSPVRALIRQIGPRFQPGDTILAVDARAYFPVVYELSRAPTADRSTAVPLLHWVSGVEPHYNGWTLIDDAENVDDAALRRDGARTALRLGPGGRLWLIASGADAGGTIDITLVHDRGTRQLDRLVVGSDRSEPAQAVLLEIPGS